MPTRSRRGDVATSLEARRALLQFLVRSLAAFVVVGVASYVVAGAMAERVAIDEAKARGDAFARGTAAPLVNTAVREGERGATAAFEQVMLDRIRAGGILHIKLWDVHGKVLWSDEEELIGRSFELDEPVRAMAGRSFVHADVSELTHPENALEASTGRLLEVYVGAVDADGVPLILETYWSAEHIHAGQQRLLSMIAPLSLGGLLLLLVLIVPLGVVLRRSATRSIGDRNRILDDALSAADVERRRVSEVLHDGVIQDLAGLGYALPSAAGQLSDDPENDPVRHILDKATDLIRKDVGTLRTMLAEIYPPSLSLGQLVPAIQELAANTERSGVVVSVDVCVDNKPSFEDSRLVYRVVREALLNVVAHSGGDRAWVTVAATDQRIAVTVHDNGSNGTAVIADRESGHLGLRLIRNAVVDVGGEFMLARGPVGGTMVRATFSATSIPVS